MSQERFFRFCDRCILPFLSSAARRLEHTQSARFPDQTEWRARDPGALGRDASSAPVPIPTHDEEYRSWVLHHLLVCRALEHPSYKAVRPWFEWAFRAYGRPMRFVVITGRRLLLWP
jgi:hypothetical protein